MDLVAPTTPTLPATVPQVQARRSPFVAAVLGWLMPGFAQLYVGRPGKALLMLVAIGSLFYAGLALTGFTCVNPQAYSLEFAAHALLGGPTAAAYHLTQGIELAEPMPWFEAGRLYAAVAGLLNVVAICDALGDVIDHNRKVAGQMVIRQRFVLEREAEMARALEATQEREARELAAADAARMADETALLFGATAFSEPGLETLSDGPAAETAPTEQDDDLGRDDAGRSDAGRSDAGSSEPSSDGPSDEPTDEGRIG